MIKVSTMPDAGLPALRRALSRAELIVAEFVSLSVMIMKNPLCRRDFGRHGRRHANPSLASISSALAGPQVPAS
jgi:hypothetical protein